MDDGSRLNVDRRLQETESTTKAAMFEPPTKQRCVAPTLQVKLLKENAVLPSRGSAGAAGYDLSRFVLIVWKADGASQHRGVFQSTLYVRLCIVASATL